jgi:murein DD-endopeptidase MepM/ murein hydrolase activator NlpD
VWKKKNSWCRSLSGALLGLLWLVVAVTAQASGSLLVHWPNPVQLFQGGVVEIRVSGEGLAAVKGRIAQTGVYFYQEGESSFAALIGADIEAKPRIAKLVLIATGRDGSQRERSVPLNIKAKAFKTESFKVPPSFDQLTPEALEEIRREQRDFARAFAMSSPERMWEEPFIRPVPQEASASSFGLRRIINGVPRAPHSGTDLSAPFGTEVVASNYGRVMLIGNYFFAGGSVVLDHGGGLFTMYFHLSEFKVDEGALVKRGEVIGLSGASGRVTGPHLHWGARLAGARIDPLELLTNVSANAIRGGSLSVPDQSEK